MEQQPQPGSEIILYQTEDGHTRLEVKLENNTVWLSLNQIAELFQRDKSVVSKHIKNVYDERELTPEATVAKFATVQKEGQREVSREIEFYNLDVIIAVGYRVKSQRGTQFRQWATQRLAAKRRKKHGAGSRNRIRNCPQITQIDADIKIPTSPSASICVICGQMPFLLPFFINLLEKIFAEMRESEGLQCKSSLVFAPSGPFCGYSFLPVCSLCNRLLSIVGL